MSFEEWFTGEKIPRWTIKCSISRHNFYLIDTGRLYSVNACDRSGGGGGISGGVLTNVR